MFPKKVFRVYSSYFLGNITVYFTFPNQINEKLVSSYINNNIFRAKVSKSEQKVNYEADF